MKPILSLILAALLVVAVVHSAQPFGRMGGEFGKLGARNKAKSGTPPVLANLRITNTGDFRIINTSDNRAVSP